MIVGISTENQRRVVVMDWSMTIAPPVRVMIKIFEQLPEDTVIVTAHEYPATHEWGFVLCSKSFEEVPDGGVIPRIVARVTDSQDETVIISGYGTTEDSSFLEELKRVED